MKKYSDYSMSYLVSVKTGKSIVENSSRKRLRRIARKKYSIEYMQKKTYVIVSGNSLANAIANHKKIVSDKLASKKRSHKANKKTKA